jgi:hypothetical protein
MEEVIEKPKKVRVKKEKVIDLSQEKSSVGKKKKPLDEGDPNEPIFREIRRSQLFQQLREILKELETI